MPVICRYRPKRGRQRVYTREDAARVVCYALEAVVTGKNITQDPQLDGDNINRQGGRTVVSNTFGGRVAFFDRDLQDILARVEARCGAKSSKPNELASEAAAEARRDIEETGEDALVNGAIGSLEAAQADLDANNVLWQSILEWTLIIIGVLTAINQITRFIPGPLRLITSPLPLVIRRAVGFQGAIIARKAANDASWARLQRALTLLKAA